MKKNLLNVLLIGMIGIAAISCGNDSTNVQSDSNADTSANNEEVNTETEEVSLDGLDIGGDTITIWVPPFGSEDTTDKEFWTTKLEDSATEINATLVVETVPWGNYEEKYLTGVSSGAGPDVGYMYNEMLYNYVEMNALEPIDKYFTQEEIDKYIYWDLGKIKDEQYTLPFIVGNPRILYCNMDLLNAAGYDAPPTTWADLEEIALAVNATGVQGFQQSWSGSTSILGESFFPYLYQAGGTIFDEEGNLALNSEEALKTANWVYSLKEKGVISESSTSQGELGVENFKKGAVAMMVSTTSEAKSFTDAGVNWSFTPYLTDVKGATVAAADCLVILSSSKNKEGAAYILKGMTEASTMEAFHTELTAFPPIKTDEKYLDDPKFENMYIESADNFITMPVEKNASQIFNTLNSNLQLMMMGEISPEKALEDTVAYYETLE